MRWIAVSLATCLLAVSLAALGWVSLTGGDGHQPRQAQTPTQEQSPQQAPTPEAQTPSPSRAQRLPLNWEVVLDDPRLAPKQTRFALSGPPPLVAAGVVGHISRYVLETDRPAGFLKQGSMSGFLWNFRFGEEGRRMIVRLLDGDGRFAWAAGYDGGKYMWVRARSGLAGCGPILYSEGLRLPPAHGAADAPPCPLEPLHSQPSTILR